MLVFTSGTTGPPKGALHGHRVLAGHLPGFELSHDFFPQPGDRIWTPAGWAWIGGLYDVVMPALAHGMPVVAFRARRFDPEQAFEVIARAGIRNVFMPATALRMMRRCEGVPVSLRTLASGGETVAFLGYWRDEEATAAKVRDGWLHTGDLAELDDEGTFRSIGRVDDLISSGGYRIGPGEIEECLIRHPDVSIAAVIGIPDPVRGEIARGHCSSRSEQAPGRHSSR